MKFIRQFVAGASISAFGITGLVGLGLAQGSFQSRLPMAITSCGQSPDAFAVSLLCKRVKLEHTYNNILNPEGLKGLGTLVIVMGGSAKGLGEAGIDEKAELARVSSLLAGAKAQGIKVIAVHVGGESRRGRLSDKFVLPVMDRSDCLLVTEAGNQDGLFTRTSRERNLPLVVVRLLSEVGTALKKIVSGS